ncbi:iron ABC transporter permease [Lentilactobacillus otakiensis]|uniref:iron ABC transporter permease n=1 Tax=Lentilactobacillus otakiensis TaxID=481720 RepID=UPI003D1756E5
MTKSEKIWYSIILVMLVVTILFAMMVGASFISPHQMMTAFQGGNPNQLDILVNIRFPRILAAMLCGGMLAVAGAASQAAFRNVLADPSILGVTSASDFFIMIGALLLPAFPGNKFILSILGGLFALFLLTRGPALRSPYRLIIIGVAMMLTFTGFEQLFANGFGGQTTGSFNGITWSETEALLFLGVSGMIAAVIISPWANYLKLSTEQLQTKGVSATVMRMTLLLVVVYLSSGVSSVVGTVPFMGIVVPNVVRYLVGRDYQTIIPLSMLLGAWLLLVVDTLGRIVVLPSELSAAVIMTVIGGPFLIFMLQRKNFNGLKSS